ncbi:MAG: RNA polymerase-binding protein DksA [Gammaproteobacteria bacterium]|tara:strand:- start:1830 stop:2417 length:588 start_codon:yes stop_codon:yes gene_type:complete
MVTKKKTNTKPKKVQPKTKTTTKAKVKKPALKKAPIKKSISKRKTSKKQIVTNPSDFESFAKTFTPYRPNKTEKYMNKSQKKHFISILSAWKLALETEQEKTEQLIQKDQSNFPDSLDRAAKEEEFMLELRKRERERKLISKIEMSLKDIDDDLYGFCETCGIEIGIKRLEARPTATQCIDCKTVDEIKEKQQFG